MIIKPFSKLIGSVSLSSTAGIKNSRHFFIQSAVQPKPIVARSHTISRALRQLHVLTSSLIGSLDCLCPLWLAKVITLVLVSRHLIEKTALYKSDLFMIAYRKLGCSSQVSRGWPHTALCAEQRVQRFILPARLLRVRQRKCKCHSENHQNASDRGTAERSEGLYRHSFVFYHHKQYPGWSARAWLYDAL